MPDQEDGDASGLGQMLELGGALFELGDGAGGGIQQVALHGLDGVGDDHVGLELFYMLENLACVRFGKHIAVRGRLVGDSRGPHFELGFTLFSGDVQDLAVPDM